MTNCTTFEHVEDKFTRTVLEQPAQNTDRTSLSILLDEAQEHLLSDLADDYLDGEILDARTDALERAVDAYHADNLSNCHANLRRFWSI